MEKYHIGEIVRYLRNENKMTQEELAEGICSSVTISRIESGKQMPSDRIINQILERLGSDIYETSNIVRKGNDTKEKRHIRTIGKMIEEGSLQAASEQLLKIKDDEKLDKKDKQYLVLLKASLVLQTGEGELSELTGQLQQALRLTKKDFDFHYFRNVPLTVREANLLNMLCVTYYRDGKQEEALELAEELRQALTSHKENFKNNLELLINVLINLSQQLEAISLYKRALEVCEEAIRVSRETKYQIMFSELHFFKAKLLHKNGYKEEALQLFKTIYPYMKLQGKSSFTALTKQYVQDNYNIRLE